MIDFRNMADHALKIFRGGQASLPSIKPLSKEFSSKLASLEYKLSLTEPLETYFSGGTPALLHFARAGGYDAPIPHSAQVGSIAGLAKKKLREIFESPKTGVQERLAVARLLEIRPEEAVNFTPQVSTETSRAEHAVLSDDEIKARIKNLREVDKFEALKRDFVRIYPAEVATASYKFDLSENALGDTYVLRLFGTADGEVKYFEFADPINIESVEAAITSFYGEFSARMMSA